MRQLAFSYNDLRINPKPYLEDGTYIGEIFRPKDIRKILENSGFFVPQQVNAWRTYIVVPPGVNAFDFIIVRVAREGLTLLGIYADGKVFAAHNEMSLEELQARNMNCLQQKKAYAFSRSLILLLFILIVHSDGDFWPSIEIPSILQPSRITSSNSTPNPFPFISTPFTQRRCTPGKPPGPTQGRKKLIPS